MRFLPTKIHGVLDYITGIILIAMPWIIDLKKDSAAYWIFIVLGLGAILYSLFTNYELGLSRKISMPVHLLMDTINGILLAGSPWLLGFSEQTWKIHFFAGIFEIIVSMITLKKTSEESFKRTVYHHTIVY